MRPAPAVAVTCSGGAAWRAVNAALPALAAGALAGWALGWLEMSALPALAVAGCAGLLAWRLSPARQQALRWDGQVWSVDGVAGPLAVMIDVGPALLLRLEPEGGGAARWIAVTQGEAAAAWHALRAAVYSRPSKPTAPRVRPPERTAD